MRLSTLCGHDVSPDPEIDGLTADSRAVRDGFLFAALPGVQADGNAFIPQAEQNGAAAILARAGVRTALPLIIDENPRARLAKMAARFYSGQPRTIAAVTGTNGKTSTVLFAAQLWSLLGRNSGSLGTLGARASGLAIETGLTTPDPVTLHQTLARLAEAGVDHLAMEISSHAIAQARADGVSLKIAAFTNITQDHLDYHRDAEDYFAAKAALFSRLLPSDGVAVVNADGERSDEIARLAAARGQRIVSTGTEGKDIILKALAATPEGLDVTIESGGLGYDLHLPLIGAFQAENALLAAGIVIASGSAPEQTLPLLAQLAGAPGRMQHAASVNGAGVYVDYAHTPDAVATALGAVRPHARGRVIAIIGAGGDRDRAKRPLMGKAAHENADEIIVTDDNPRLEDPAAIREAVAWGAPGALNIGDRAEAIAKGIAMLKPGDVLVIAGKGHETGQQVGAELLPFDDVAVAQGVARASTGMADLLSGDDHG